MVFHSNVDSIEKLLKVVEKHKTNDKSVNSKRAYKILDVLKKSFDSDNLKYLDCFNLARKGLDGYYSRMYCNLIKREAKVIELRLSKSILVETFSLIGEEYKDQTKLDKKLFDLVKKILDSNTKYKKTTQTKTTYYLQIPKEVRFFKPDEDINITSVLAIKKRLKS